MRPVLIAGAVRTPIGKFLGGFARRSAVDLGVAALRGLLERTAVSPSRIQEVFFGQARQAGGGPNPARQISVRSGIPEAACAMTVNQACGSGLRAVALAAQSIAQGEADLVVAGGTESMSRVPFFLDRAREGYRLGHGKLIDGMYQDGFHCPLADELMGKTAENVAAEYRIDRAEQDEYAVETQRRCGAAIAAGRFRDELLAVDGHDEKGKPARIEADEHPRPDATLEGLARLPPVFLEGGTVHAGNSSGITDGAAALLVVSEDAARELGLEPLARFDGFAQTGVAPRVMGIGPVPAVRALAKRLGRTPGDWDLIELNEAFAAQVIACVRDLGLDRARLNVNGGSIALGHPIGCTGARIVVTLLHELERRKAKTGLATLCISGGMGMAMGFVRE